MDGILGTNHIQNLTYISTCVHHNENYQTEIEELMERINGKHFRSNDVYEALKNITKILEQIPSALKDCTEITGDIQRVQKWNEIFKDPFLLAFKMAKNILFNGF